VRDPRHNQWLKLSLDGWDELGEFENGITANFVGPDDPLNRGPNTVVEGKRRPVFLIRSESEKLAEAEPECGEAPELTRSAEPESPIPIPTAASKRTRAQTERAERYIAKHFPNGAEGITTAKIRETLVQDKDLQTELKQLGSWDVPSLTSINRVLGRRKA
jgi:hypothetical protein